MPVSPLLSNLLLKEFDEALAKRGIMAIRYADDIAVFADTQNECRDALRFIKDCLANLDLQVPELEDGGKTVLAGPSAVVEFLGLEIRRFNDVYRLCVPAKRLAQIDANMAEIASIEGCVAKKRNIGNVVRILDAFIIGHSASMAVLENRDGFLSRLESAKRKHLKSFLIGLIGEQAVKGLNSDRLAILGLSAFAR